MHRQHAVHKLHLLCGVFAVDHARQISKLRHRQPLVDRLMARKQEDIDNTYRLMDTPAAQKPMGIYLEKLKQKKK